jgi:hypothetical protein
MNGDMAGEVVLDQEIVAVFGTNKNRDHLPPARLLGAAVYEANAVVLTGATGPHDIGVKGAALQGAEDAAEAGPPATWIGVPSRQRAEAHVPYGPRSVLLVPGGNDDRNFVEACLCDAAIALGATSDGTASEVLFCLYLGRPVVIVGNEPVDVGSLRKAAKRRVCEDRELDYPVDKGISDAYRWARTVEKLQNTKNPEKLKGQRRLLKPARFATSSLPRDDAAARQIVGDLLRRVKRRSPRPDLDGLGTADDWDAYWDAYVAQCLENRRS